MNRPDLPNLASAAISKEGYIDAMRGLAVCGVVAVHCSQSVPSTSYALILMEYLGRRGVQMFFMLSALTLCLSWYKRAALELAPVRNFYLRRLFRIAPLFYVAMACYLLLHGLEASYWAPAGIGWQHILLSSLFLNGLLPDTINAPVPGGWSIAVEMCFYLLFPLLMLVTRTLKRTLVLLIISIVISRLSPALVGFIYGHSSTPFYLVNEFATLNFTAQLPVFLFGILVFHLLQMHISDRRLALFGITTLVVLTFFFLLPSLPLHHLIGGALSANLALLLARWPIRLLVNRITRTLGKLSYGIYLSHFAVITLLENIGATHWTTQPDLTNLGFFALALAVSALVSLGLHRSIEVPCIRLGSRVIERLHTWKHSSASSPQYG